MNKRIGISFDDDSDTNLGWNLLPITWLNVSRGVSGNKYQQTVWVSSNNVPIWDHQKSPSVRFYAYLREWQAQRSGIITALLQTLFVRLSLQVYHTLNSKRKYTLWISVCEYPKPTSCRTHERVWGIAHWSSTPNKTDFVEKFQVVQSSESEFEGMHFISQ